MKLEKVGKIFDNFAFVVIFLVVISLKEETDVEVIAVFLNSGVVLFEPVSDDAIGD